MKCIYCKEKMIDGQVYDQNFQTFEKYCNLDDTKCVVACKYYKEKQISFIGWKE